MQGEARLQKEQLVIEVSTVEATIASLASLLGEPPNSDPATLLAVIWTLALAFDRAHAHVLQCLTMK